VEYIFSFDFSGRFEGNNKYAKKVLSRHGMRSLQKQPSFFAPGPSGVLREGRLRFPAENSILMTQA